MCAVKLIFFKQSVLLQVITKAVMQQLKETTIMQIRRIWFSFTITNDFITIGLSRSLYSNFVISESLSKFLMPSALYRFNQILITLARGLTRILYIGLSKFIKPSFLHRSNQVLIAFALSLTGLLINFALSYNKVLTTLISARFNQTLAIS